MWSTCLPNMQPAGPPNPDVLCNREIKFDLFRSAAMQLGADAVATGHYCRKETTALGQHRLLAGRDGNKDQSYFLCQIDQDQLGDALFPVGELEKPEVRRIARESGLPTADKKDSQGLCFVGKVKLPEFLQQQLSVEHGPIIEVPAHAVNTGAHAWSPLVFRLRRSQGSGHAPRRSFLYHWSAEGPAFGRQKRAHVCDWQGHVQKRPFCRGIRQAPWPHAKRPVHVSW